LKPKMYPPPTEKKLTVNYPLCKVGRESLTV
jgi:hypothetical protein